MLQLKVWVGIKNHPIWSWRLSFGIENNVKTLTHSQHQPQGPKAHKKKSTIRLTIRTMFCDLQRSGSWSRMKSSARHTLSNKTQLKNHLRAVNLTENYTKHTIQAPCCCFENGLTMHLLLVETINVSID